MTYQEISQRLERILEKDKRYKKEAYEYVMGFIPERHITIRILKSRMAANSSRRYGPIARVVWEDWGIRRTSDITQILENLSSEGLAKLREGESLELEDVPVRELFQYNPRNIPQI